MLHTVIYSRRLYLSIYPQRKDLLTQLGFSVLLFFTAFYYINAAGSKRKKKEKLTSQLTMEWPLTKTKLGNLLFLPGNAVFRRHPHFLPCLLSSTKSGPPPAKQQPRNKQTFSSFKRINNSSFLKGHFKG